VILAETSRWSPVLKARRCWPLRCPVDRGVWDRHGQNSFLPIAVGQKLLGLHLARPSFMWKRQSEAGALDVKAALISM